MMQEAPNSSHSHHLSLTAKRLGIKTRADHIIYMRMDCDICRSEGFTAQARIRVSHGGQFIIATIHHVTSNLLEKGEAGLSDSGWEALGLHEGASIELAHPTLRPSLRKVRGKIYGRHLSRSDMNEIIQDVSKGRYSDIELAAFITACSANDLDLAERVALTAAMVGVGETLSWDTPTIVDKHCVGGLPGNRTSPIVVAIAAANGLVMPKTSSRAITSPAGTADTMETLTNVNLDLTTIRKVVHQEGGCLAWGGAVNLSPTDDMLIRIERALDIDSDGQLVASVLSKKIAAGSSHLVLDIPYGPTAKVRSQAAARTLAFSLTTVADAFGLRTKAILSDGSQPIGRGIGPALEALDVLAVLQCSASAPTDLKERAINLAGALLELADITAPGTGATLAEATIENGTAWQKFQAICNAQGGLFEPPTAKYRETVVSERNGFVRNIDNRQIAQTAKLLGAPEAKAAGVSMNVRLGDYVVLGQPLYTLHAETPGEMAYSKAFVATNRDMISLKEK